MHSEQDRSDINLDFLLKLKTPEGYKAVSELSFNQNAEGLSCINADNVIIKKETSWKGDSTVITIKLEKEESEVTTDPTEPSGEVTEPTTEPTTKPTKSEAKPTESVSELIEPTEPTDTLTTEPTEQSTTPTEPTENSEPTTEPVDITEESDEPPTGSSEKKMSESRKKNPVSSNKLHANSLVNPAQANKLVDSNVVTPAAKMAPQTGDRSNIPLWLTIAGASAGVAATAIIAKRKKKI